MKQLAIAILATTIGGLIVAGFEHYWQTDSTPKTKHHSMQYSTAKLLISGTNSEVKIYQSESNTPYQGGVISGTNSDQIVFLPKGQLLVVKITGTRSDLLISKAIADQVSVNNTGTNSSVELF